MQKKKKLAFLTPIYPDRREGGIETATSSLAREFTRQGIECYCVYYYGLEKAEEERDDVFAGIVYSFDPVVIREFLTSHGIEILINQATFDKGFFPILSSVLSGLSIRVFSVYHSIPGFEAPALKEELKAQKIRGLERGIRKFYRLLFFKKYERKFWEKSARYYNRLMDLSDGFVMLTGKFIPQFMKLYRLPASAASKITAIPNPLSYDYFACSADIEKKVKEVLIVARFDEVHKKLSLALEIWSRIEKDPTLRDWKLTIVGHGRNEKLYHKLAKKLKLERVSFEGKQDPYDYYMRSSIFMMTSAFEGFGITLTEAQQCGVVPMAFDSFASVHDIITSGENGILINFGDIDTYVSELSSLMKDDVKREEMAARCVEMADKFSVEKVAGQWTELLGI